MQGRKPYREEWKIFDKNGLNPREWLVQKTTAFTMQIVNKTTKEQKVLDV